VLTMTRVEDGRFPNLKGTPSHAYNYAYISHHNEGIFPSSLLWNARFGHICNTLFSPKTVIMLRLHIIMFLKHVIVF
jgi:hypothetical protein